MNKQCIIFVLKNNEKFLVENLEKIYKLKESNDVIFVTRESKDRTNSILKLNNFINLELVFDPGYYEALKCGFEFIRNSKYDSIIEFGECDRIAIDQIDRLIEINKDYNYEKTVIFASRYYSNKKKRKRKIYIYLAINRKITDPYSRFRIYNKASFDMIKNSFNFKIRPYEFLDLIYKKSNFIEVKTLCEKQTLSPQIFFRHLTQKFRLFMFSIFILFYIKRFGLNNT